MYQCQFENRKVVVKFTLTYGKEVHEFMYDEGIAPKLLMVEKLKGGWIAVVMEYIAGESTKWRSRGMQTVFNQVSLTKLKERNYVHGDLWLANIMKHNEKFILLDYDWAGTERVVHFPLDLNTKLKWQESVIPGGYITTISDYETVENLANLK